ncbi:HD domain-containing protein [Eggerthia catenaformis]|uniref:HD domain-containing protein n=1 Tax=Eggerthia catenaformis TaxID=31973 RepID=UPI00047ACC76|nr:HD domain-containing protein [Eggerthia catenaformis]
MFSLEKYKMKETRVFRDVIHGYITVEYLPIWYLINTKEFQRLRRIKQLGGTSIVFPTAEHSRFVHSLGVYEMIRNMIELDEVKEHLTDYEKLTVLCAGLLHDIGHGPFSHSFEDAMQTNHEEMTVRIIKEDSEIHTILVSVDKHLPEDVASIIEHRHKKPLLVQMVSSQLDADRMDYLLRDSYFSGVTYGEFDKDRILRTLRIVDDRIVFKYSGVQAIENYILARYHMYWQVYYHPTAKSYELVLKSISNRLADLLANEYIFKTDIQHLIPFLKKEKISISDYMYLDEAAVLFYFKEFCNEEDSILSDLCQRFINRHLFKYCTIETEHDVSDIEKISLEHGYDPRYYVLSDDSIQIPYKHYAVSNISEIEILLDDGSISSLPDQSEIVNAIIHAKPKRDHIVFYVKEIAGFIGGHYE